MFTTPFTFNIAANNADGDLAGCPRCIRSGFVYCSKEYYTTVATGSWTAGINSSNNICCKTATTGDCSVIFSGSVRLAAWTCSSDFAKLDIALGACPNK